MFFEGKAEFRQPHAFRNLEEVYPDGQPLPRIDDSDRIEFFESQRFRTGAKGKKQKKKTPDPPRVPGAGVSFDDLQEDLDLVRAQLAQSDQTIENLSNQVKVAEENIELNNEVINHLESVIRLVYGLASPELKINIDTALSRRFGDEVADSILQTPATVVAIPEGGIDAEPAEDAEDADVEVVGVSKKEAKKQVKVKVEPEEVIEPEPESDVDSVDEDTEETQVLDAALKTLPKIK